MPSKRASLIIAGGGTGGHVLAGISIADEWKKKFPDDLILFVGAHGGIEANLVPRAGYPLELLHLGSLNQVSMGRRIKTAFQLPLSLVRSFFIILKHRPRAVIGVGGYASGPLVLLARLLGRRTAILEQNSVPGFTNRVLGRIVNTVFCAFPGTENGFPKAHVILTGNPIRSSIKLLPPTRRNPFTVFVFGGSQGALGINTLVLDALPLLKDIPIRVIHQTGEKDYERVREGYRIEAKVEKFIYDMPQAYAQASLLVCRAGSSTLAEIAAVGRAAILVPFPFASDNHQQKNAEVFVRANAARLLIQNHSKGSDLAVLIRDLYLHPEQIEAMEKSVTQFWRPHAANDIVEYLSA